MNSKYSFEKYVYFSRWISYWYQIKEVLNLKPEKLLIIGKGDGIVENVFKKYILEVKTLDIEKKLKPDIIASVENMPLEDNSFDVILCAEVLEHLPFEKFPKALKEIKRVSKNFVVLSLPHWGWMFYFGLKLPFFKKIILFFKISGLLKHKFQGEHFWEIGKRDYSLKKIKKIIQECGFKILKDFINYNSSYHHFFVLKKL